MELQNYRIKKVEFETHDEKLNTEDNVEININLDSDNNTVYFNPTLSATESFKTNDNSFFSKSLNITFNFILKIDDDEIPENVKDRNDMKKFAIKLFSNVSPIIISVCTMISSMDGQGAIHVGNKLLLENMN